MQNQFCTKRREEIPERRITWQTLFSIGYEVYLTRKHYKYRLIMQATGHLTNDLNFIVTIKPHCILREWEHFDLISETLLSLQAKMLRLSFSYRRHETFKIYRANQFQTSLIGLQMPLLQISRPHTLSVSNLTWTRVPQTRIWTWDHRVCEPLISQKRWLDHHDMASKPNEWPIRWCQTTNCQGRNPLSTSTDTRFSRRKLHYPIREWENDNWRGV